MAGQGTRWAVVTGTSSGIGRALAQVMAREGWSLVLVARREAALRELAQQLSAAHGTACEVVVADLGAEAGVRHLMQAVEAKGLAVEALVNNAGYGLAGELAQLPEGELLGMVDLNVRALTQLTRWVLPGMLAAGRGHVLNVASTAAFQPGPLMAVYYATKAYVLSLSEALAEEVRGTGVSVTALCPGFTETEFAARAGERHQARLFRGPLGALSAADVAEAGYRAMVRGRRLEVPGLLNRVVAGMTPLGPRSVVLRVARYLNARAE